MHIQVGNAGHCAQFFVGQLDLAGREVIAMDGIKDGKLADAGSAGAEGCQGFACVFPDGTDDADAGDKNPFSHQLTFFGARECSRPWYGRK